jgi:hypothetical protein
MKSLNYEIMEPVFKTAHCLPRRLTVCCCLLLLASACKPKAEKTGGDATLAVNPENRNTTPSANAMAVTQAEHPTPSYAASTKTWEFGNLTWSDAIQIPECNKNAFAESLTQPQCRSYTSGTSTWYYYNWPYVDANKSAMCPSPWRVPAPADFHTLADHATASALISAWDVGGAVTSTSFLHTSSSAYYWSATEYSSQHAYYLFIHNAGRFVPDHGGKYGGFHVRCVK